MMGKTQNKDLKKLIAFLIFINFLPIKALASDAKQIHKLCLEARDYKGCIDANKNFEIESTEKTNKYSAKEECFGEGWCIAKDGKDFLGMQKITDWSYLEDIPELTISYFERVPRKVKVRGNYGRYIEIRSIKRKQFSPQAGSSPSFYGGGETNCYDTGYGSMSCSSNLPTVIPGSPSTPGGVGQILFRYIIDCQDKTYQKIVKGDLPIRNGRLRSKSKWIKLSSNKANWHPKSAAREYCMDVDKLTISDFIKYE